VAWLATAACAAAATPDVVAAEPASTAVTVPDYGSLWVARAAQNSLVEYGASASGASMPSVTISGPATGLSDPAGVTVDHQGDVFAVNAGSDSITEYAPGASGDAAPVATISGSRTGIAAPSSIAVLDDHVWVSDPGANLLLAFTIGSSGDILPAQTIAGERTRLDNPVQIAASQDGFGIWALNRPSSGRPSLTGYADEAGNVAPTYRIAGKHTEMEDPAAIAVDSDLNVEVADRSANAILRYDGWVNGSVDEPPDDSIGGSRTLIDQPDGVSVDAVGNVIVANSGGDVLVFGGKGYGNYAPQRVVTGAAEGSAGIFVPAEPPRPPTHVHPDIRRHSVRLRWDPPRDSGGGLFYYQVCAAELFDSAPICASDLSPGEFYTRTHVNLGRLQDGVIYIFAVQAINATGESPLAGFKTAEPRGAPAPPVNLAAATTAHTISLAWSKPDNNGGAAITSYRILTARCHTGRGCSPPRTTRTSRSHVKLRHLRPRSRYMIKVRAVNKYGAGRPATEHAATR